jgi:hypothetical protein
MPVIQARVTEKEEAMFRSVAEMRGVSVSQMIRNAMKKDIEQNLPKRAFGCRKGEIRIADDFCEPLGYI